MVTFISFAGINLWKEKPRRGERTPGGGGTPLYQVYKTGVGNNIFWSEIGSGFGDAGGTPPPKIPRSTPAGGRTDRDRQTDSQTQIIEYCV